VARKKDQEARRLALGEAVRRAVLTRGLEGVRLRDIAEEAGVTPAAVLYYGDVDALTYDTYQQAIERFSLDRERVAEQFADARDRLRASIDHGVASGPGDELVRLLFEFWPRSLRDPKAAVLDSSLQERQIAVYSAIFVLGTAQGHFTLTDPPRLLAGNMVAMEDGYQMEILSGRRTRDEVKACLHSYARAVTGCDIGGAP
jgi:AcrR family transcriptional regulator